MNLFAELLQVLVELMRLVALFIRFLFMAAWAFFLSSLYPMENCFIVILIMF